MIKQKQKEKRKKKKIKKEKEKGKNEIKLRLNARYCFSRGMLEETITLTFYCIKE